MNSHILAGIRERDKLLSQFKRNKDSSVHEAYCKVQNSAQRDIKRPKANYFENKVKTANFPVKKALGHYDFAYDMDTQSHPTSHKCVQGFLKYPLGIHRAI